MSSRSTPYPTVIFASAAQPHIVSPRLPGPVPGAERGRQRDLSRQTPEAAAAPAKAGLPPRAFSTQWGSEYYHPSSIHLLFPSLM
jgi:hypothetical protein